ncbi:Lycopene cyclase, partial [hydrothermal vent metagenome]
MASGKYDLAIVGGGLSGGLLALALREKRPELRVALIEAEDHFGGNHIWSFFDSDIEPEHRWLVDPLISKSWDSYDVHFPKYSRSLQTGYNSITSKKFNAVIGQRLDKKHLITGSKVKVMSKEHISFSSGKKIAATTVIDARGGGDFSALEYGWQKFLGQMLHLKKPHGLDRPVIMDARVDQLDGYHFVYCLPFGNMDVFVEETYYSNGRDLDKTACRQRIAEYAARQGWEIADIAAEEFGQLPVVYGGDFDQFWQDNDGLGARIGARAALAHPITSYSLPMAVRTAISICEMPE